MELYDVLRVLELYDILRVMELNNKLHLQNEVVWFTSASINYKTVPQNKESTKQQNSFSASTKRNLQNSKNSSLCFYKSSPCFYKTVPLLLQNSSSASTKQFL
ncbi:hypothetical protein CEXT_697321 [Caerostris extrusa]|uniref:Uncharacterized protein n=1 Tax=Caerostris extrusa TaxID=172846 RepID=A0AAV4YG11_CAEEX|nr:hypothetical protein CEXT_697321 [Caerostris extrusa]